MAFREMLDALIVLFSIVAIVFSVILMPLLLPIGFLMQYVFPRKTIKYLKSQESDTNSYSNKTPLFWDGYIRFLGIK